MRSGAARTLAVLWLVALLAAVWAVASRDESCPDEIGAFSDRPECDWSIVEVTLFFGIPLLAFVTVVMIVVALWRRRRRA